MDVQFKENHNATVTEGHGSAAGHAMSPFMIRLVSVGTMFDGSVLKKLDTLLFENQESEKLWFIYFY